MPDCLAFVNEPEIKRLFAFEPIGQGWGLRPDQRKCFVLLFFNLFNYWSLKLSFYLWRPHIFIFHLKRLDIFLTQTHWWACIFRKLIYLPKRFGNNMTDILFLDRWAFKEQGIDKLHTFCLYLCKKLIFYQMNKKIVNFFLLKVLYDLFCLLLWHSFGKFLG